MISKKFFDDKDFQGVDFRKEAWQLGDYEACTFVDCNLSGLDLSESRFIDCTFKGCDLSNAKILETSFQDVFMLSSKCLGLMFDMCSGFSFSITFDHCQLNHSSFFQVDLQRSVFKSCEMSEVDLSEANLTGAKVLNCDLLNATFDRTKLEKCDLSGAFNLRLDPEVNDLRSATISLEALPGLLSKYGLQIKK